MDFVELCCPAPSRGVTVLSTVSTVSIELLNNTFVFTCSFVIITVRPSLVLLLDLCSLLPNGLSYRSSCTCQYLYLVLCCVCPSRRRQHPMAAGYEFCQFFEKHWIDSVVFSTRCFFHHGPAVTIDVVGKQHQGIASRRPGLSLRASPPH